MSPLYIFFYFFGKRRQILTSEDGPRAAESANP